MALSACGENDGNAEGGTTETAGPSEEYRDLLVGLEGAATANRGYGALRRAKALPPAEEAAVYAFCEIVWKVDVNQGGDVTAGPPLASWIRGYAESNLGVAYLGGKADLPDLSVALAELDSVVDVGALDGALSRRYKRACYA